jgi:hypothetical protein
MRFAAIAAAAVMVCAAVAALTLLRGLRLTTNEVMDDVPRPSAPGVAASTR